MASLHLCCMTGIMEMAVELLDNGALIDALSETGATALQTAIQYNHKEITSMLLDRGAQIDMLGAHGLTALHTASMNGRTEIVELLLSRGAKTDIVNLQGECALHIAAVSNYKEIVSLLMDKMIQNGISTDIPTPNGKTALHIACETGKREVAVVLLNFNANLDILDCNRRTALQLAARNNHLPTCVFLVERGADPYIGLRPAFLCYGENKPPKLLPPCVNAMKKARLAYMEEKNKALLEENTAFKQVIGLYSSMLLSEKFADVVFETADGERLFAHKCILAATSKLMDRMLSGAWSENQDSKLSVVKVPQSALAVRALLTFIYTGEVDKAAIASIPIDLFDLVAQHSLSSLMVECEKHIMCAITSNTVAPYLIAAHLHQLQELKRACITFIRANPLAVMGSSSYRNLEQTHKAVWSDLLKELDVPNEDEGMIAHDSKRARKT